MVGLYNFKHFVNIPADEHLVAFLPIRIRYEVYEWLICNIGAGFDVHRDPPVTFPKWESVTIKPLISKCFSTFTQDDKDLHLYFRYEEDAVWFKMVWL
jgi:hypothetical protein